MAVYKVLQDIEAEDKLLGPLTLKGFIYAAAAGLLGFINFKLLIGTSGNLKWLFVLIFLPAMVLFGILASPLGRQQPTEVWLLAHIRFLLKPRRRLWDQTGLSKLVTITAPVKIDKPRTKGLSEIEVKSRLQTLAVTLDSRGWAIKNLSLPVSSMRNDSDRLVAPTVTSAVAESVDIKPGDDILDEKNNPTAQNFDALIEQSDAARRLQLASRLTDARKNAAQSPSRDKPTTEVESPTQEVTVQHQADKLELAQSGSALSVASVAKLVNRASNEVVIALH